MLKLPYLGYSRPDRITNQLSTQLLPFPQENRLFKLKQVSKHVSHYECQKQTDQTQTVNPNKTSYSFQKYNLQKITFKRDKSQQILQKAIHINNKHYPKSKSSFKNILKNSTSLDKKNFDTKYDKQNCLTGIQKTLKFGHPMRSNNASVSEVETKLHKIKNPRLFRSQWFNTQKQT